MTNKVQVFSFSICFVIMFIASQIYAQNKREDAQLWTNIYLEKKILRKLNLHLNQETRFSENITRFGFAYADLGLTYKLTDFLNTTGAYVFIEKFYINKHNTSDYFSTRHQFYYNLTFKASPGKFKFSLREQLQNQVKDIYSSDDGAVPYYYLRNKLTVKYEITRRITPYLAGELYYQLSNPEGNEIDRTRFFAGTFYKLSKKTELEFYFLWQEPYNMKDMERIYVYGIGYGHTF